MVMLKKISTLKGAHILGKKEQKSINGGGGCPGPVCPPNYVCCKATNYVCVPPTGPVCP
tara:strand:+ start:7142 stop:7318 length:177 start_codon:yes stop_codon:yes gene_type:complete